MIGECLRLSVLLKMNAVHIYLTDFHYSFFQQYLHFERGSNLYDIYLICDMLLLWRPIKPGTYMKLTVVGQYLSYYEG